MGALMAAKTITTEFADDELADSAIGRLEVLGVPPRDITRSSAIGRVTVTAKVEERLVEKALPFSQVERR